MPEFAEAREVLPPGCCRRTSALEDAEDAEQLPAVACRHRQSLGDEDAFLYRDGKIAVHCRLCLSSGDEATLLLCDGELSTGTCNAAYHTTCVGLSDVPYNEWFCPACVTRKARTTAAVVKQALGRGRRTTPASISRKAPAQDRIVREIAPLNQIMLGPEFLFPACASESESAPSPVDHKPVDEDAESPSTNKSEMSSVSISSNARRSMRAGGFRGGEKRPRREKSHHSPPAHKSQMPSSDSSESCMGSPPPHTRALTELEKGKIQIETAYLDDDQHGHALNILREDGAIAGHDDNAKLDIDAIQVKFDNLDKDQVDRALHILREDGAISGHEDDVDLDLDAVPLQKLRRFLDFLKVVPGSFLMGGSPQGDAAPRAAALTMSQKEEIQEMLDSLNDHQLDRILHMLREDGVILGHDDNAEIDIDALPPHKLHHFLEFLKAETNRAKRRRIGR